MLHLLNEHGYYYNNFYQNLNDENSKIQTRSCVILNWETCTWVPCPDMAFGGDFQDNTSVIENRWCDEYECSTMVIYSGCNTDSGIGSPVGTYGNSGNGSGSGSGSGSETGEDCGYSINNAPFLCLYGNDLMEYGVEYILEYNKLISYLNKELSIWMLDQFPEMTLYELREFNNFIENYSDNQLLNAGLLELYIYYLKDSRSNGSFNLYDFSDLMDEYLYSLNNRELDWIEDNIYRFGSTQFTNFLNLLSNVNLFDISNIELLFGNIGYQEEILEFVENEPNALGLANGVDLYLDMLLNGELESAFEVFSNGNEFQNYESRLAFLQNYFSQAYSPGNNVSTLLMLTVTEYCYLRLECDLDPDCQDSESKLWRKAIFNVLVLHIHTALDIIGLFPAAGEAADALNGIIYLIEGDEYNAGFSFAATIPAIAGWTATGAKISNYLLKFDGKYFSLISAYNASTGLIEFGSKNSSKLRDVLGITDIGLDAHHLIPFQKCKNHELIQKAASHGEVVVHNGKEFIKGGFHMDHFDNGVAVTSTRANIPDYQHANHPNYDTQIENTLTTIWNNLKNEFGGEEYIPTSAALDAVKDFQGYLKKLVEVDFPTTKINELVITYP